MSSPKASNLNLFERAQSVIPGGVNSPVRAFKGVGGNPPFISSGRGAHLFDEEGNRYIDYVQCWGALIAGHCFEPILAEVSKALSKGTGFGAPTSLEVELAEEIISLVPSVEMVRLVNSGTEATMTAARLARGYTERDLIIKFDGCYHGHADSFLVAAGSGVATLGIAGSPGVPKDVASLSLSIEFNDLALFEKTLKSVGAENVAAVIVEPVAGNMGLVKPVAGFLEGVQKLCREFGIVFIVDEVMSGFRVSLAGAADRFGIAPDLITMGKIIGGGLPLAALGGRSEIMKKLAPVGPVYQAGTLSGNPLAVAAGIAALKFLKTENPYPQLEEMCGCLVTGLRNAASKAGVPFVADSCGAMFGFFFSENMPRNFTEVKRSDVERFKKFFHLMLQDGVFFAPSAFEAGFIGAAHSNKDIEETIAKAEKAFAKL